MYIVSDALELSVNMLSVMVICELLLFPLMCTADPLILALFPVNVLLVIIIVLAELSNGLSLAASIAPPIPHSHI